MSSVASVCSVVSSGMVRTGQTVSRAINLAISQKNRAACFMIAGYQSLSISRSTNLVIGSEQSE